MNDEINYRNNPLHGVSLKKLLIEVVGYYGFDILFAYLNINCFKTNPSIESSLKFLKKTNWAREKVENFYLYEFKNLPRASDEQFELSPRDRIVPEAHKPGEPEILSLEDAERLRKKREKRLAERGESSRFRSDPGKNFRAKRESAYAKKRAWDDTRKDGCKSKGSSEPSVVSDSDPWAKWNR
jgi:uncharacterized protein (DUF2132 family)